MRGICFIGAGKMATAIAGGMVRKNIKTEIHTFDPLPAAAEQFCRTCGGKAFPSPAAALENTDAVLLAVKPQYLTGAVEAQSADGWSSRSSPARQSRRWKH